MWLYDNWFTSLKLINKLVDDHKISFAGTVKKEKQERVATRTEEFNLFIRLYLDFKKSCLADGTNLILTKQY